MTTKGEFAHAIVAQAAGGAQTGGAAGANDVVVSLFGSTVATSGTGAAGIVAQNAGAGAGSIHVGIDDMSSVTGGAGRDSASAGTNAAIIMSDGTMDNSLDLDGTLTSANGAGGIAVKYEGSGKVTINNNGHMTGTVVGNPSGRSFDEEPAGIVVNNNAGSFLEMGGSSCFDSLTNLGRLEVGCVELFDTLISYGDIHTGDGGKINFELGSASIYDRMSTFGELAFNVGSTIDNLWPQTGLMFDIAIAETLTFDSTDPFSFFSFSNDFPKGAWGVSIVTNFFGYDGPFDLLGFGSPEVLRLTYSQPAPVPLPATIWIYLAGVGVLGLRRARR